MIDIKALRSNPKPYQDSARRRGISIDIDKILELDKQRLELIQQVDRLRAQLNVKGKPLADELQALQTAKAELAPLQERLTGVESELAGLVDKVPNLVAPDVPDGKDESDNVVLRQVGKLPKFKFEPLEHWQLGQRLGLIDNERAAEVAGSRFTYLKGNLARLQFALVQFVIDTLTSPVTIEAIVNKAGLNVSARPFIMVVPPVMIRPEVMARMARLEPRDDRYHIPSDDLYLIGSAEHTLGPLHMDETLSEDLLPVRYLGYSTAFRREAGSYGKDVRGILRLHQFDKLEMESFVRPEDSLAEQDFMVAVQEHILHALGLPYQVVAICTGDMGDPDYRQIDIETWLPGQNQYRETHTADAMADYQARRLGTRLRRADGTTELVHMNDATAVAIGRTLIAILENYQTDEGEVTIPDVLRAYMGGEEVL